MTSDVYYNPIIPGFYPDPSICRVEDDYYLVNSTFSYFPGIPIFHSKDLVNWTQIGNVLDRNSQVNLDGAHSQGIYAPTIRYNKGRFYIITTNVSGGGNFIVYSDDPKGPWSEPFFFKEAQGIDPSIFFDDDGKIYYVGTREKPENIKEYYGDNEIWLREIDLKQMKLVGKVTILWNGAMKNAVWPEGPHIYKKDGYYYLMIAEGGTSDDHAITIARSKKLKNYFEGCPKNPIITHRNLGKI